MMKILVSYLTGIGNTILCIPALRALHQQMPDTVVDIAVRHQGSKEILERIHGIRYIWVFNPELHRSLIERIRFFRMLRQERYDVNITAFPSNRAEFNVFSLLVGAKRRVAPRYPVGYVQTLGFLQNERIVTDPAQHDIEQNLSLLAPLGIDVIQAERDISWPINELEQCLANEVLKQEGVSARDLMIGLHSGCNPGLGNIYKRWPTSLFAGLADRLIETFNAKIFIFGDDNERELKEDIQRQMRFSPIIPRTSSLLKTAAMIKMCRLFVTNDSGLMHVASAMGVPTVSLFGPSDPVRNAPYGNDHTVLRASLACSPCNTYPHAQWGGSFIRCIYEDGQKGLCMQQLSVDRVYTMITQKYADVLTENRE